MDIPSLCCLPFLPGWNNMVRKNLSILVIGCHWPPETFLARLFHGLIENGVAITIAGPTKPAPEWLAKPNFHWLYAPSWKGFALKRFVHLGRMWLRAQGRGRHHLQSFRSYIPSDEPLVARLAAWNKLLPFASGLWDVIYFPWNTAAINYLPLFDLDIPTVISCRGSQVNVAPHNPKRTKMVTGLQETFKRATAVHCVSEDIKQEAQKYGLEPEKAWVIPPAVDPDFFCPPAEKQSSNTFRIVTTGSLVWRKGIEFALTAVRHLVDQGVPVQFEVIGDGPERQRLLYTISDLDLEHQVQWRGKLKPIEVRDILQKSDVFLLASHSEGLSNAALEAMACGLPVVTTDCGGMREAISDGVEGILLPMQNPYLMAQKLCFISKNPGIGKKMGQKGRLKIISHFTLSQQSSDFISLLDRKA